MEESVERLRREAPHWSLAGDHKLLDILQTTHQRIISKCKEVSDQLDVMVTSLDDASISLQNVNNRFMALSNSQFIESRVYDDDADVATDTAPAKEPPKLSTLESDLQSLKRGLQVLEDAHETLTILHDSDTDTDSDDEAAARTVLRPKDVYSDRPLPYIIGTAAWKNKWHAGLVCSDSDSDSGSRRSAARSEYSDSEPELEPDTRPSNHTADVTLSETSSERASAREETPPPAPAPAPAHVAAELARRLGGQLPKMEERDIVYEPPRTNKVYKPQQPTTSTVFSDEPPPLDDMSDSPDDDIFAELHKSEPYAASRGAPDLFTFPQQQGGGIESTSYEEGDIFSDFAKPVSDPSAKQRPDMFTEQQNMFPNKSQPVPNSQDTVDDTKGIKKPVGAISLFGSNKGAETIGAAILKRNRKSSTSCDDSGSGSEAPETKSVQTKEKDIFDDLFAKSQKINNVNVVKDDKTVVKKQDVVKTKVDLFSDNIFDDIDDIFTTNVVKKPENTQKSLFDDEDELFSDIAAPKTVKSDAKASDNKKSLFDSDDDELFGDKSKMISKDKADTSESTKISKHNEQITKKTEITKDLRKEITSTNNSTKISKANEQVTPKVETTNDSTKISNIFDDDDDEDMFTNVNTKNKNVQNKLSPNVDNLSKPDKTSIKSPSLFDDDDEDLFTKPTESSKPIQKDTAINNQSESGDIFGNTDDDLFVGAIKTNNLTQNDTVSDETDRVIKSSDTFTNEIIKSKDVLKTNDITVKNNKDTAKNDSHDIARDVNIDYAINSDVTRSVIKSNESDDDDFEQDFDDLPTRDKNIITETKPTDIFDNTDDLLAKPAQKHIDKSEGTIKSSREIINNTPIKDTDTENIPEVSNKTHIEYSEEDIFKTPKPIPKIDSETHKNTDKRSKTPENTVTETDKDNNTSIINKTDTQTSVFEDIFTEPPVFEKPKEPKKSKNVNALFDDDSDDEALFFKKNDIISDEKPNDFKLGQDRFDIFIDEPPDVDVKIDSDDELFSSLPISKAGDENVLENESKHARNEYESTETSKNLNRRNSDDIFDTLPKPTLPGSDIKNLDKNIGAATDNVDIKDSKHLNTNQDKDGGNKSTANVNKVLKSDSDDLFKALPKPATKPSNNELGSDDDLFNLPQVEKPATTQLQSEKSYKIPTKHVTIGKTSDTDDEELFKSLPGSEKDTILPKTAVNKSKDLTSQSEDLFKPILKDKTTTSLPKNELKADSDEDLFKTLPNNITLPHTLPQKNQESSSEESPKKVGKLKTMNFNINVNALLPGASPKKQIQSPTEPQESDSKMQTVPDSKTKSEQSNITVTDSNIENPDSKMVKSVSFEKKPEAGILDNKLSKERAKIQVKRRPSTRRARREAVRKSAIDLGDDSTDNSSSIDDPPKTHKPETDKNLDKTEDLDRIARNTENVSHIPEQSSSEAQENDKNIPGYTQTVKTENLPEIKARPSTRDVNTKVVYILNDEDIFNTPAVQNPGLNTLGSIYTEKNLDKNPNTSNLKSAGTKTTKIDVDNTESVPSALESESRSSKDNSNEVLTATNLKSSVTKTGKSERDSAKKSIFDSDSDGELFTVKRDVKKVVKGRLFSDDDDDDLFGVKKKNEPKQQASRSIAKEPQKPTEPVLHDPLSMLGDDD